MKPENINEFQMEKKNKTFGSGTSTNSAIATNANRGNF